MKKAIYIGVISIAGLIVSCGGFDLKKKEEQAQADETLSNTMSSNKMMGVDKSIFRAFKIPKADANQPVEMDTADGALNQGSFGGMKALVKWTCSGTMTPKNPVDADNDSIYKSIKVDFQCKSSPQPLISVESKGTVSFEDKNDNGFPSAWRGCSGTYPSQGQSCSRSPINTTIKIGTITQTLQKTFDVDTTLNGNILTFTTLYLEMVLKEGNTEKFKAVFSDPNNLQFQVKEDPNETNKKIIMDDGTWNGSIKATIKDVKGNNLTCTATATNLEVKDDDPVSGKAEFSCQCPDNTSKTLKTLTVSHTSASSGTVTWTLCDGTQVSKPFSK